MKTGEALGRLWFYRGKGSLYLEAVRQWILPIMGATAATKYLGLPPTRSRCSDARINTPVHRAGDGCDYRDMYYDWRSHLVVGLASYIAGAVIPGVQHAVCDFDGCTCECHRFAALGT